MQIEALVESLAAHGRARPDQAPVVARMLGVLGQSGAPFSRSQLDPGHFTASGFVLSPERKRLLLVRHAKLGRWLQPGGHVEAADASLRATAEREVGEETGVLDLSDLMDGIFDVDAHLIPATAREGAHVHFDVRYAFRAGSDRLLASDEVGGARWVELAEVAALNPEESIVRPVERLRVWQAG